MSDEEYQQILQNIIDLATLIGWTTAGVQNAEGVLIGAYIGENQWVLAKTGSTTGTKH